MKLAKELESLIIENALGEVKDAYLIQYIKTNTSLIPPSTDEYIEQQVKRLLSNKVDEIKSEALLVDVIFGSHIDLAEFEERRLLQIKANSESMFLCQKIISAHQWLSGGFTVNCIDNENKEHSFFLEYPLRKHRVRLKSLMGALYIDSRLVPVRSTLEFEIFNTLQSHECEDNDDDAINIIIDFVSSANYVDNARKLGRII